MDLGRLLSDHLSVMDCFDDHWNWRWWLHNLFNVNLWNFYLNWIWNPNFFNNFIGYWYFNSYRNFNHLLFDHLIGHWYFDFDIFFLMYHLRGWLLDNNLGSGLRSGINSGLRYRYLDLLNSLNWLKGSNWLHSCYRLILSMSYKFCLHHLSRLLICAIILRLRSLSIKSCRNILSVRLILDWIWYFCLLFALNDSWRSL